VDREQTTAVYDHEGRPLERAGADDAVGSFTARTGVRVFSVAGIRDIVNYIYEEGIPVLIRGERRPMDRETKAVFDAYMEVYGV
jgi:orotate phosphoribosyltransferase